MKTYTEEQIKRIIVEARDERQDYSDYDYDDNFIPDEEYYGWQNAISFIQEKLGIEFKEDEFDQIQLELEND